MFDNMLSEKNGETSMPRYFPHMMTAAAGALAIGAVGAMTALPATAVATDLIISEYVEGSGNNKAIELFNGTAASVDLSAYTLEVYSNGGTSPNVSAALSGSVAPSETFVFAGTSLADLAQQTTGQGLWNGDDAIVLRRGETVVDSFGQVGVDPGTAWTGGGVSALNQTLRRATSVCSGDTDPSDAFDPSAQWVQFAVDTFDGLGSHSNDCATTPVGVTARINEFSVSTAGVDVEYVEVFGEPDTDYSDLTLLAVDGAAGSPTLGEVILATPVATTDSAGLWSESLPANTLPNGTLSLLLVSGYVDQVVADADLDGQLDDIPGLEVIDAVAVSESETGDLTYANTVLAGGFDAVAFTPGGASRIPDGTDTDSETDWLRNDFDLAGIDGFDGTPVFGEAFNTPGASNAAVPTPGQGGVCGDPSIEIGAVQGPGAISPLLGETVSVEGVVTADFLTGGFDGYFVQDAGDGEAATSDALFIFAPDAEADSVAPGDRVRVEGTVSDPFGMTQLSNVALEVCDTDVALPELTELSLPLTEEDYESVEGMYVNFSDSLAILEYFDYGRFGEIALGTQRQYQPTAVFAPGSPQAEALLASNTANRLLLDDGRSSQNPDPARHPNGDDFTLDNRFRGGDVLTDTTGVIDYRFNEWKVQPTEGATYESVNPRTEAPQVAGSTTVASFNVLNYFTSLGERGADNDVEFERQEAKIVAALAELDADIVGLIEIENNGLALTTLVDALNDEVGADTYAALVTGPLGTDAITTAFIYKTAAVIPTGDFATLNESVDARFLDNKNRPALAQTFTDSQTSGSVTVVVNHLKSKGSSCDDVGDPIDPDGQGNCNGVRTDAAEALVDWTANDPTGTGEEKVLVIGDLNSYGKEDPIEVLTGGGFTDLIADYQGEDAYSYVFDGQLGYLDYALANAAAAERVTTTSVWNINADEASLLDYDTSFKADAQDAIFAADPYRSSDHDPVVVGLDLADEDDSVTVRRIAGADRYAAAANVARTFTDPGTVYVASGEVFPDALAAAPVAIGKDAPVVLTRARGLPAATAEVLAELNPERVVVVGGSLTIPETVLAAIEEASGAQVTRVTGANRYDLAANISREWEPAEADTVYLASGTIFSDALAVGPLAGIEGSPVLLTREASLSAETAAALDRLDPEEIVILGGPARISDTVLAQASQYGDISRLFGADRYETAELIAMEIPDSPEALLASGQVFPDALAGGVYAGVNNAPLLLTKADSLNTFAASALQRRKPSLVTLVGGEMTLFDQVRLDVIALLDR